MRNARCRDGTGSPPRARQSRRERGTVTGEPSALKRACWVRREAARKRPGFRILEPGTSPRSPPCHLLQLPRTFYVSVPTFCQFLADREAMCPDMPRRREFSGGSGIYIPRSTANSRHSSGMPFSSCTPRSMNLRPDPATRSLTVFETSTSLAPACAATRAPV